MRILHAYCLNYNLGDYFLSFGLKNLLRNNLQVSLIGDTNIQGREFNEYYINEVVNKRYDLLVIGGGGIIHGSHWPNGWFWLIERKLIKSIKIPFIVYGIGNNYWEKEGKIPSRTIDHLKETIDRAVYFSVRNDGSLDSLTPYLSEFKVINVVPDPGFYVNLNFEFNDIQSPSQSYIVIQLANDKMEYRFGSSLKFQSFIQEMRKVVFKLSKNYKILFAPHVLEDVYLCNEISSGIKNTEVWNFGYFAFDRFKDALKIYRNAKFVVSMRGHGQIIPIGFNIPVISLINHPKHLGLMECLGLSHYCVNILEDNWSVKLNELFQEIEKGLPFLIEKYRKINKELYKTTDEQFTNIKRFLS